MCAYCYDYVGVSVHAAPELDGHINRPVSYRGEQQLADHHQVKGSKLGLPAAASISVTG